MRYLLLLAAAVLFTGASCTSQDVGRLTEAGVLIAGEDPEKAAQLGSAAGKVAGAAGEMAPETQYRIGSGIAVESFARRGPLHPDRNLQQYVNKVGKAVARVVPRQDMKYSFAVVQSNEVNAWAAPGGFVFITTGALAQMSDEAELAGVLAHELAHVNEQHMVRMLQRASLFEGLMEGVAAGTGEDLQKYNQVLNLGTEILFDKGLDRNMEYEADLVGMEFATLAGYDPGGLPRFLRTLAPRSANAPGSWLGSTHPSIENRLERVDQFLQTELAGFSGATNAERFAATVRPALTQLGK